jgi:histidinol-phosphate aminotransferase
MAERVHGGIDEAELRAHGLAPEQVVDFSVNLNPYGPCPALIDAVRAAPLDRYPDPRAREARAAWAAALDRDVDEISVGHGAADLFWAIARAFFAPGERVVIAEPTFSELRVAAQAVGADVKRVFARPERSWALDLDELADVARSARALYLCSPNNPTGEYVSAARVCELALRLPGTLLVLDQSFVSLSDHAHETHVRLPDNVICVRSLTKEFACPGLRIGMCCARPDLIARIEAVRPTWHTSTLALAALTASAGQAAFVQASWQHMRADREAVRSLLQAHGMAPLPSATSYQLLPLARDAQRAREALLAHGILVRDCASFGLPRALRIAALPGAARERLGRALDAVRLS